MSSFGTPAILYHCYMFFASFPFNPSFMTFICSISSSFWNSLYLLNFDCFIVFVFHYFQFSKVTVNSESTFLGIIHSPHLANTPQAWLHWHSFCLLIFAIIHLWIISCKHVLTYYQSGIYTQCSWIKVDCI